MEKKNIRGRITFVEVSTEELIDFFVQNTSAEIETSGGITRQTDWDNGQYRLRLVYAGRIPTIF